MSPIDWATLPLKKYADFSGRAPRAEYWWYVLFMAIVMIVAMIIEGIIGLSPVILLYGPILLLVFVLTFIPSLSVLIRRLHDNNRSGWWAGAFWAVNAAYLWSMRGMFSAFAAIDPNDPNPDPEALNAIAAQSAGSFAGGMILGLVQFVLAITLLVFLCSAGTDGENKYGPDPYGA